MLSGTLDTFSVGEILELVGAAGATGVLHVRSGGDRGAVRCDGGAVSLATVGEGCDLGTLLVRGGFVSATDWNALADHGDESAGLRGLLERPETDGDRVQRYLATQTEESIFELDCWREGELRLEADDTGDVNGVLRYHTADLLASIAERKREWRSILKTLGSPDHVVHQAPMQVDDDGEMSVSRAQLALLSQIDGRRSVRELARDLGAGLFHTGKTVASLTDAGLVVLRADRASESDTPVRRPPAPAVMEPALIVPDVPPDEIDVAGSEHQIGAPEFVEAGDGPARDLIVRLLSAVKEEL